MSYLSQLAGWIALQVAWQTLAVAMLLLVSLRLMRGVSAAKRYRCAALHLAGAICAAALSLLVSHASVAARPPSEYIRASRPARSTGQAPVLLPAIASIWLGGTLVAQALLAIRFLRLRRFIRGSGPAAPEVVRMVEELSAEIGLSRPPGVRCADVHSPLVAGGSTAILVTPRGFAEMYPSDEIRALLAHELAHIQRRDYSRNALQLFAVSFLWWHPGAWFIYSRIRHERECASDEQAVRLTGSAMPLAQALLRLADTSMPADSVLIGADSSGLSDRICRIAYPGWSGGFRGSAIPACAFVLLAGAGAALSSTASRAETLTRAYAASWFGPRTIITIQAHDPAGNFLVTMVRGRVLAVELDEVKVPVQRLVQDGDTVRVMGDGGEELLRLEVDPRGGFRWNPRRSSSAI